MNEEYLQSLNHDLSFRPGIIREALTKGIKFGSKEFFVYSQLRWYETDGKFGFCVAGDERLGQDLGMTATEVKNALNRLKDCGLVEHVWCDKRVYRNKTKVWMSMVRLSQVCTNVDAIKVLKDGAKNTAVLGETVCPRTETVCPRTETVCPRTETVCPRTVASPVTTGVGNTKEILSKYGDSANATSRSSVADATATRTSKEELEFPFDDNVIDVRLDKKGRQTANAKAAIILRKFGDEIGIPAGGSRNKEVHRIKQLLDDGYTEEDILWVAKWSKSDEFYKDSAIMSRLSADAFDRAKLAKDKNNSGRIVRGFHL